MKLEPFYKTTLVIDDPETAASVDVRVRVKRLTLEESSRFSKDFYRSGNPPSAALIARKPEGDEQETRPIIKDGKPTGEEYVVGDDEVKRRRIAEMDENEREAYREMDEEDEAFSRRFVADTISNFITVEPDQIHEDGPDGELRTVTKGADLVRLFGGRQDVLGQAVHAVWRENTLSAASKKVLRSLRASGLSSATRPEAAPGLRPEPTVGSVASEASVASAAAIGPAATRSS